MWIDARGMIQETVARELRESLDCELYDLYRDWLAEFGELESEKEFEYDELVKLINKEEDNNA